MTKDLIDNREPFKVEDRVSHKIFGEGFVKNVTRPSRGYSHVEVEFDEPSQVRNMQPTRFRKLVSTYLEKVDVSKRMLEDEELQPLEIEGLENTGMTVLKPSE